MALAPDLVGQVAVLIPAHVIELDEAHAALGQPAGQQAVRGVAAGLLHVRAVQVEDRLRLAREVGQLGDRRLHPVGQLVLGDAGDDLGVAGLGVVQVVERGDLVEHLPARRASTAGGIGEVEHRLFAAAELDALIARRQEAAAPEAVVERLIGPAAREQARRTPAGPGSRSPGRRRPRPPCWAGPASCEPVCTKVIAGSWLIASVCIERMMQMSSTMLAVCGKSSLSDAPLWPCRANLKIDGATGKLFWPEVIVVIRWPIRTESGSSIPRRLGDRRLVVEQIHLRRCARLEQVDDPLGLRREMRQPGQGRCWPRGSGASQYPARVSVLLDVAREQRAQGHRAQADPRALQEDAAIRLLNESQSAWHRSRLASITRV